MRKTVLRAFLAKLLVGVAAPCAAQMFPQDTGPTYFPVQQTATNYVTVDGAGDLDVNVGSAVISNGDLIISNPSLGIRFGDNSLLTTGNVGATSDTNTWTGGNTFVGVSTFTGKVSATSATFSGAAVFAGSVLGAGFQNILYYNTSGQSVWTVPANVYQARFLACGAGGGGGSAGGTTGQQHIAGGGGSGACYVLTSTVTPNSQVLITIGAGGAGSTANETGGSNGSPTYIDVNGSTITIAAGGGGGYDSATNEIDGGSGGEGSCGSIPSPFSGFCIIGNAGTGARSNGSVISTANGCNGSLGGASPFFGGVAAPHGGGQNEPGSGGSAGGDGGCVFNATGVADGGNGGNGTVVILY